jgi:hypothetical protein
MRWGYGVAMRKGGIISAGIRLRQTFNRISDKALDRGSLRNGGSGAIHQFVNFLITFCASLPEQNSLKARRRLIAGGIAAVLLI